jgi:phage shock protein E
MVQRIIFITLLSVMFNLKLFGMGQADSVDVNKFDDLRKSGYTVIDVRTQEEFDEGHIEGAVLINLHAADFNDKINALDKAGKYLVYCRSGRRSNKAVLMMNEIGINDALNLIGGITAWKAAGKPVVN